MKSGRSISTVLLFLGLASSVFAYPPQGQQNEDQGKNDKQDKQARKGKNGKQQEQKAAPQAQAEPQQQRSQHQRDPQPAQAQQNQQEQQRQQESAQRLNQQQARGQHQRETQQPVQVVQKQQENRPPGWDKGKKTGWNGGDVPPGKQARYSNERQQQLISQQQQRVVVYRTYLDQRQSLAQQYSEQLQRERRMASYRYQQEYWARMQQQQLALQRNFNYNNDPYFYTAPSYRYSRGGTYFEINQYGANTLRQAINYGYEQGFRSGQADRQDRWSNGYQNSYAYQDANYGYDGYYGDQDSYNYYFRQGFTRGYQDGYNSRSQYGSYSNGRYTVLGAILGSILNLQALR